MKITVRNVPFKGEAFFYIPAVVTYRGKILPNEYWVPRDCITLSVPNPTDHFPFRVIKKSDIVAASGQRKLKSVWQITGSRGNPYTVTFDPLADMWSCTCPGYHFRRSCRHVNERRK
jgi:hypothetical protein